MSGWQRVRSFLILALAMWYFGSSLFGHGGGVASAKGFALLALAMAWLALDRTDQANR